MSQFDPEPFAVSRVVYDHHAVVVVVGELDAATAPVLRDALLALEVEGVDRVVIDLRRLSFVDSSGLSVLVNAKKRLKATGNSLCLVIGDDQGSVRRIFEITGLDRVMPIHAELDDAINDCLNEPAA